MDMHAEKILERPFLPHDLIYIPTQTGLAFQRGQRMMSVNGRNAYDRFSRLAPRLDGSLSITQMDQLLAPSEIPPMEKLLGILMQRQFLLSYDTDLDDLPAELRSAFDQQIRFLHHLSERPAAAFLEFRHSDIRIAGRGEALDATIGALTRNGAELVARLRHVGECSKADLVLYVSDTPNIAAVLKLASACREACVPFLAAIAISGNAVIGPFVEPESGIAWEDALLRVLDHQPAAVRAGIWRHIARSARWMQDALPAGAPQLQIIGNHVAFAAFMALCGVRKNTNLLETISLETLDTKTATLLPHPDASAACAAASTKPAAATPAATGFEGLGLVGSVCGVFHAFDDDGLLQVPVFRTRLRAHLDIATGSDAVFVANSFASNAEARALALAAACCEYAVTTGADRTPRPATPELVSVRARAMAATIVRGGDPRGAALAGDVRIAHLGRFPRIVGVPAAAIFTAIGASAIEPENFAAGLGCDTTAESARTRAIRSLLRFEALKALALGQTRLRRLTLAPDAPGLLGLYDIAAQLGCVLQGGGIAIHDCFVSIVAPAGELKDAERITVGCGDTALEATREALVEATALAAGGQSALTVAHLLPRRLGYQRIFWTIDQEGAPERLQLDQLCPGSFGGNAELLHIDITPADLRQVGLFVVKALLARVNA